MKKIYLLLLFCCFYLVSPAAKWYSMGGPVNIASDWNSMPSGSGTVYSGTFSSASDTFVLQVGMTMPTGSWTVAGVVMCASTIPTVHPGITKTGSGASVINFQNDVWLNNSGQLTTVITGAGSFTVNVLGNFTIANTARIYTPTGSNYIHLHFSDTTGVPMNISWTTTDTCNSTAVIIDAKSVRQLTSNVLLPFKADVSDSLIGTLICGTYRISSDSTDTFTINTGATIYTASTGGLDTSIQYMYARNFSGGAHYIYNGTAIQVTGTTLPLTFVAPGSVTIDNTIGVNLSPQPTVFDTGSSVNLEQGIFGLITNLTMQPGSMVNVDNGNFDNHPNYGTFTTYGVNITYENLGIDALAFTTGYELQPTIPNTTIGKITVNKPGATITMGSPATANGLITLSAGTLDASTTFSNIITANSGWVNNAAPNAFVARSGEVEFSGAAAQTIGGSYSTSFYDLTIDNNANVTIADTEYVNGTLDFVNGKILIGGNEFFFGPSATTVVGAGSSTYIVDNTGGHVHKQFNSNGNFLFPIGDATNYSPITLNMTATAYPNGDASVTVNPVKDPSNRNINNFTNRYWKVYVTGMTGFAYSATATFISGTFPAGDVTGSTANISMGEFNGTYPWTKFAPSVSNTLTTLPGTVSDTLADFTGISTPPPYILSSATTRICVPLATSTVLKVDTSAGDTVLTYTWAPSSTLSSSTGTTVTASPLVTTTYTVTITDGNGFTNTSTTTVIVDASPYLTGSVITTSPVCVGDDLTLTAVGPVSVATFSWAGPVPITSGGTTDIATVSNVTTAAAGTYTVTLTNGSDSGCTATYTNTLPVVVNTLPGPTVASGAGTFCASSIISATNAGPGTVYFEGTTRGGRSTFLGTSPQTVTATGMYYFNTMNTAGCWGQEDSVYVVINPLPTLYALTGGGDYCLGTTGKHIGLVTSDVGISYKLYFNGIPTNDSITGTGAAIDYGIFDSAGSYTITGTNLTTGCSVDMGSSVSITIDPLPTQWSMTGAGGYCLGGSGADIGLNWSDAGTNYQLWYEDTGTISFVPAGSPVTGGGSVIDFGLQTGVGTYMVIGTNSYGCIDTMVTADTNQVWINPLPTVYAVSGGGTDCANGAGFDIILNNSDVGTWYQLVGITAGLIDSMPGVGDTVHFGFQNTTDTYISIARNSFGCVDTMAGSGNVVANPLPNTYAISPGGSYCVGDTTSYEITLSSSDTGVSYQLLLNGINNGSPLTGTGTLLDFGGFTTPGTYTIVDSNLTTGCVNSSGGGATPAQITVNALPVVYSVSGSGSYCAGGSGVDIILSGSEAPPMTYLLYLNGTFSGSIIPGTGSGTLDLGFQTSPGTYTVVAQNSSTGCISNMTDSAVVVENPLPTVYNVTGGGSFCGIDTTAYHVGLLNSQIGISYQLYKDGDSTGQTVRIGTGGALDFGAKTITGLYTIVGTDMVTGCTSNMNGSATIISYARPTVYNVTGGGAYCAGLSGVPLNISGTEPYVTYQVYDTTLIVGDTLTGTGSPGTFGMQTLSGSYTVIATNDTSGCASYMTGSPVVVINPLPAVYAIAGGGGYCAGDTGVHIFLDGSSVGRIHYQLYRGTTPVGAPLVNTGFGLDFGLFNTVGTYSIIATDTLTGCVSNMVGTETISINSVPSVYNVSGGGTFCAGAPGDTIFLSGSQAGIGYQLYNGTSPVGTPLTGTGSPVNYGPITTAGRYTVIARNLSTGCHSNMVDTATIIVNPLPHVYTLIGGGRYCFGGTGVSVGLTGSDTNTVHYQLLLAGVPIGGPRVGTSSPISFGLLTPTGTYKAIAMDTVTGCLDTMSGTITINTNPLPPAHTITGGGVYCQGDTGVHVGLNGSNLGIAYQLYGGTVTSGSPKNGTGRPLDFGLETVDSTYTVIATDTTTHCVNTMTGSVTVSTQPYVVPVVSLTATGGTLISVGQLDTIIATVTGVGTGTPTYQWLLNNNVVPGATTNTFVFSIYFDNDSIVCNVTSTGMCGGITTSKLIVVNLRDVAVKQIVPNNSDIKLIPNPNKGMFNLKGTLGVIGDQDVYIEVTNMLGQVVYKSKVVATNGVVDEHIELNGNIANGMYLLNLRSGDVNDVFHFVVEQ